MIEIYQDDPKWAVPILDALEWADIPKKDAAKLILKLLAMYGSEELQRGIVYTFLEDWSVKE